MKKRLGIYLFNGAEVIDWAAPFGVFAVARRMDPELDVFLVGETAQTVHATGDLAVTPRYDLADPPHMDAFLLPGGIGTRAAMHDQRLRRFLLQLPEETLLASVCTGSWILGQAGLLDGLPATSRKNGDPSERLLPIDRLGQIAPACQLDYHRIVDTGRILTAGGISSGLEMGLHLLERFGHAEDFVALVAHIMEYDAQWALTKSHRRFPDPSSPATPSGKLFRDQLDRPVASH